MKLRFCVPYTNVSLKKPIAYFIIISVRSYFGWNLFHFHFWRIVFGNKTIFHIYEIYIAAVTLGYW